MPYERFHERPIAITDVETTGLWPSRHEIIEIGLVVADFASLEIVDTYETKVLPEHIETADKKALEINGFNLSDWDDAVSLRDAMEVYSKKTFGAIFCAHNVSFDLPFIKAAFRATEVNNNMDYHTIDIPSVAWAVLRNEAPESVKLSNLAKLLGLEPEPTVHRAINGAMLAHDVLLELLKRKDKTHDGQLTLGF